MYARHGTGKCRVRDEGSTCGIQFVREDREPRPYEGTDEIPIRGSYDAAPTVGRGANSPYLQETNDSMDRAEETLKDPSDPSHRRPLRVNSFHASTMVGDCTRAGIEYRIGASTLDPQPSAPRVDVTRILVAFRSDKPGRYGNCQ